uniref:Thiol oxidase n=1 Tax=Trieres chinensis TaxID=1514140 RepID=A0A6U1UM14_TRICV
MRERYEKENKGKPDEEEVWKVRWPTRDSCPACWKDDGTIGDTDAVYKHLKQEYLPRLDEGGGDGRGQKKEARLGEEKESGQPYRKYVIMAATLAGLWFVLTMVARRGSRVRKRTHVLPL